MASLSLHFCLLHTNRGSKENQSSPSLLLLPSLLSFLTPRSTSVLGVALSHRARELLSHTLLHTDGSPGAEFPGPTDLPFLHSPLLKPPSCLLLLGKQEAALPLNVWERMKEGSCLYLDPYSLRGFPTHRLGTKRPWVLSCLTL